MSNTQTARSPIVVELDNLLDDIRFVSDGELRNRLEDTALRLSAHITTLEAIEKEATAVVDDGGLTSSEEEDDFCTTCHRSSYHHEPNCTAVALRAALKEWRTGK